MVNKDEYPWCDFKALQKLYVIVGNDVQYDYQKAILMANEGTACILSEEKGSKRGKVDMPEKKFRAILKKYGYSKEVIDEHCDQVRLWNLE